MTDKDLKTRFRNDIGVQNIFLFYLELSGKSSR